MFIMTDTTNINVTTKYVGAKPRLSLLSSKQTCTRLNSDDSPITDKSEIDLSNDGDRQINGLSIKTNQDVLNHVSPSASSTLIQYASVSTISDGNTQEPTTLHPNSIPRDPTEAKKGILDQSNNQQHDGIDKLSVSKEDLIALLSMLKSELQSKELALASMKLEQLKRLMNPVEISRSALAKTYTELQDKLEAKDHSRGSGNSHGRTTKATKSSASIRPNDGRQKHNIEIGDQHGNTNNKDNIDYDGSEQETIEILSTLLELLDRHPLLALPRDSIYCLDYNCNETSTKNYLNLKIQHLENLIEQHRRFRFLMRESLRRSEQRSLDLTLKLELERKLRTDGDHKNFKNNGMTVLLGHIDRLKADLEEEKANKHAIVMTLLNELLDEREKNEALSDKVAELEKKLSAGSQSQPQGSSPSLTNQQSVCKPRVPVKPAQLLDRQLSQLKNR